MSARFSFILAFSMAVFLVPISPAGADPVNDLYSADVAVHDQGSETRNSALQDALAQVIVKVTGSQRALETTEAAELLENPARFLQQYRYEAVRPAPVDPAAPALTLHTEFDGAALEQRLRTAGFPLWGRERPLSLAWIAFSDGADRRLVGDDPAGSVAGALRRAAQRRGLPLVLPVMDMEDAMRVSFMDVWGVYEEPLIAAAGRYSPDAILAGSIFNAGNGVWAGRWTLLRDDERQRFEMSGASPEAVATAAIDALAEHFAQEFAVDASLAGGSTVTVEVTEVGRLASYAKVLAYLSGLSTVKDARLALVDGSTLRFDLELNSGVRALEQSIALGRVLEPLPAETIVHLQPPAASNDATIQDAQPDAAPVPQTLVPEPQVLRYRYRG